MALPALRNVKKSSIFKLNHKRPISRKKILLHSHGSLKDLRISSKKLKSCNKMMSLNECNSLAAPDELQLNMETISKELNDLIVTADGEIGIGQQISVTSVKTTTQYLATAENLANYYEMPTYTANTFYGNQQICAPQGIQYGDLLNHKNYQMLQQPITSMQPQYSDVISSDYNNAATNIESNHDLNGAILRCTPQSVANVISAPTFEFHYLLPRAEKEKKNFNPVSSINGQGAFRKANKHYPKHSNHPKVPTSSYLKNDEIPFDLSILDNEKPSNVRRIFDLLYDLYVAVAEAPVSLQEDSGSQFEETFLPLATRKKTLMPTTLNVQNQVKQACRKLTIFTCEMQRIVSGNQMYDAEMHAECEFYLNQLQQSLHQLETFKCIAMEHRQGKFLSEDVNAHAERLLLLLEHTNRQIREVHVRILAADWYIGVNYRGDIHLAVQQFKPQVVKKSRMGVINEILQMCNIWEAESLNCNKTVTTTIPTSTTATGLTPAAAATATTTTTTTTTTTEAFKTQTSFKAGKQLLFNKEANTVHPLLMGNNKIFSVYKPIQTKLPAATAATGNRQPVFYIG